MKITPLTPAQKTTLVEFIVAQPNTQTPLAIIAKAILDMNQDSTE